MKKLVAKLDVYKKIDPELTRGTTLGALVSVLGIGIILALFYYEAYVLLRLALASQRCAPTGKTE